MGEKAAPTKQHCRHIEEGVEMLSRETLDVCQNKSSQLSVSLRRYCSHPHLTSPLTTARLSPPILPLFSHNGDNSFPYPARNNLKNKIIC